MVNLTGGLSNATTKLVTGEQGRMRKLSQSKEKVKTNTPRILYRVIERNGHGPYQVIERNDPDLTISKVYYPQEGSIQVHQERICFCPPGGILLVLNS